MSEYLTVAQARQELGVSAYLFNENFRPKLTEIPRGKRTVLFDRLEVEALKSESDPMFNKKKVSDALDHAWETKWQYARGQFKKERLKDKVDKEIGDVRLDKLDYARIEEWVQTLRDQDRAADTIKSRLSCLSVALDLSVKRGWIKSKPPFPEISGNSRKTRYLLDKPDEEALLLKACGCLRYQDADILKLVIVFMLDTGCRVSELTKLRWGDVRQHRAFFHERKSGDSHSVKLTQRAENAIDTLLENDHWLKWVRGTDKSEQRRRTAQNRLTHAFAKVRDEAGMPDVSLHTLRHTCASRLVQAGVSLYEVSRFLGHSSITVTERYAHLAPNSDDRAAAVLENRKLPSNVRKLRPTSQ